MKCPEGGDKVTTIEVTKTELVWPGKYNEDGTLREVPRVSLPFQVIETVNQSRATREAKITRGGGDYLIFGRETRETLSRTAGRTN